MQVDCSGWLCKLIDRAVQDWTREGAHELHELDESYEWELCASLMTVMSPMSLMSLSCVCVFFYCACFYFLDSKECVFGAYDSHPDNSQCGEFETDGAQHRKSMSYN